MPGVTIDIHTHVVPDSLPAYPFDAPPPGAWPSIAKAHGCCARHVMIAGEVFRTIDSRAWDGDVRLSGMDECLVGMQVLSPMPELLSYWLDAKSAVELLRHVNGHVADMASRHAERFTGLGAVPLQDVDVAIKELRYLIEGLGLAGVEIGSNVNGRVIGDPVFEPFWAAVEDLGAAVFIHPVKPLGGDRLIGPPSLKQLLAYPSETGLALASLMTGGVLERHPNLRIAASHGGGTLSAMLPRLQHGWKVLPKVRDRMPIAPVELARRLFVDSLVYSDDSLAGLIRNFGEDRVVVGSDYPFAVQDPDPVGTIDRFTADSSLLALLKWRNAERWLGLPDGN